MKKLVLMLVMTSLICTFSACGDKQGESGEQSSSEISVVTSESTSPVTSADTEPAETEQVSTTKQPATTESVQTTAESTAETVTETTATTAENNDNIDVSDGIVFDTPVEEQSDEELISAALALFQSACKTEWDYTVGSPYELDTSQTAQNKFGWDCYLITTEGINSLADVRADYHRIFSENYPDTLDEVFTEADGRAYCLNGARGADIFYEKSVITAINSRSESEIAFTVTNYYSGDDFGNEPYTSDEDFVISVDSDGAWRVAKFRMPY
ncbi:MAG: hypothetical protein NC340_02865 [Ruminococcus flavefaciens]|nr:hypothetical protein [Ruminococcus flavefaciens]MCM1229442.1 hypothetical protein [Ruminococcus flavefaciens]